MKFPQRARRGFVRGLLHERLHEQFIGALREFGQLGDRLERLFVLAPEAVEVLRDLFETVLGERDLVSDFPVGAFHFLDRHRIEAGRQRFDGIQHADDLCVLLLRDLARHEDAQMPDTSSINPMITCRRLLLERLLRA